MLLSDGIRGSLPFWRKAIAPFGIYIFKARPAGFKTENMSLFLASRICKQQKTRYRIANQEIDALSKDIDQTKKTAERNFDLLRALMEETDIRTAEVKRDAYEFRRDIVITSATLLIESF